MDEQENIFDVPHSLPSSAHPIALATRTPTGLVKVESTKFIPDYGGSLEIPGTKSKRYCLRKGLPFCMEPKYLHIIGSGKGIPQKKSDDATSLIVASYLNPGPGSAPTVSVIRAIGSTLYFNAVQTVPCGTPDIIESSIYSHVPYPFNISGLKYCDTLDKLLLVKFEQGVKLVRLNQSYKISGAYITPESSDTEEEEVNSDKVSLSDQTVMNFVGSFPERRGLQLGDVCLTTNQRTLATASSDQKNIYIKLYDINRSKKFCKTIVKARDDNAQIVTQRAQEHAVDRKKTLRSFISIREPVELMQQLESNPFQLLQMMLTTSNRVSLVDIRSDSIQHNYVDRFRLLSALPTELFSQIRFSKKTDQQFYLLSNERVRVFDKRFLSQPMVSLEHMLDPTTHASMNMRLISRDQSDIETLCISSNGRLCFTSFDQSIRSQSLIPNSGDLVNPCSLHAPFHEPSPAEISGKPSDELSCLDVSNENVFANDQFAFSVFQLSQDGDISVRIFEKSSDEQQTIKIPSQAKIVLEQHKLHKPQMEKYHSNIDNDLTRIRQPIPDISEDECLNILDSSSIVCAEDKLASKRALEKFDMMKMKLYKR